MHLNPFTEDLTEDDDELTPFPVMEHRYFTPAAELDLRGLVAELSKVSAVGELALDRTAGPHLALRAGALRAEIRAVDSPRTSLARAVVRAMNELLDRAQILDRFIPLEWMGGGEVFVSAGMDQTLELLSDGHVAVDDMAELIHVAAW